MPNAGRPRSEQSRCNILEAALRLARTRGYARITIEEIAAEAGAGKQTIYRWWRSKAYVVLDALKENARVEIEVPDTGSLRQDIAGFLWNTFDAQRRRPGITRVLQSMMAEAQLDAEFAESLRNGFIEPRRKTLKSLFTRACARGEVGDLSDLNIWVDIAFGVLWYRILVDVGPLDKALAEKLADLLAAAAGAGRSA